MYSSISQYVGGNTAMTSRLYLECLYASDNASDKPLERELLTVHAGYAENAA